MATKPISAKWRDSTQARSEREETGEKLVFKMPQISPKEFYELPLRVHAFLARVPLHDVWAVDLQKHCDGVTLSEFLRKASQCGCNRLPPVSRGLVRLRLFFGRIFRLDTEPKDASAASFGSRLTPEDRVRSLIVPGTAEGLFRVVYRFENEQLLEIHNRTVHAAALSALVEKADSYRFYFAVYVRERTWITPFYMGLIDPFRRWIIYPAMLKTIRASWDKTIAASGKRDPPTAKKAQDNAEVLSS